MSFFDCLSSFIELLLPIGVLLYAFIVQERRLSDNRQKAAPFQELLLCFVLAIYFRMNLSSPAGAPASSDTYRSTFMWRSYLSRSAARSAIMGDAWCASSASWFAQESMRRMVSGSSRGWKSGT